MIINNTLGSMALKSERLEVLPYSLSRCKIVLMKYLIVIGPV